MTPTAQLSRRRLVLTSGVALALGLACMGVRAAAGDSWLSALGSNRVVGSGTARTESRAVSGFQAVALAGAMTLVLRQGALEALELRGDDNLLPIIQARVVERGGTPPSKSGRAVVQTGTTRQHGRHGRCRHASRVVGERLG